MSQGLSECFRAFSLKAFCFFRERLRPCGTGLKSRSSSSLIPLRGSRHPVPCAWTSGIPTRMTLNDYGWRPIATAKEELATLVRLFPELREQMHDLDVSFQFCYDTPLAEVEELVDEKSRDGTAMAM